MQAADLPRIRQTERTPIKVAKSRKAKARLKLHRTANYIERIICDARHRAVQDAGFKTYMHCVTNSAVTEYLQK
jgi:hypothetical protein